jgi:predicted transcriptional regulator
VPDSYLITKETLIAYHLAKLKALFQTSQAEIRESILFLVAAGLSVDRIQNETGASRASIYRYTKQESSKHVTISHKFPFLPT